MKTNKTILLGAAAIAVCSIASNLAAQEPVFRFKTPTNRAVLASPRAIEVFPWLARRPVPRVEPKAEPAKPNCELIAVTKSRAFASSPRVLEQFPELALAPRPEAEQSSKLSERPSLPASVAKNKALASSPRVLEEFPELPRRGPRAEAQAQFQIAPLK